MIVKIFVETINSVIKSRELNWTKHLLTVSPSKNVLLLTEFLLEIVSVKTPAKTEKHILSQKEKGKKGRSIYRAQLALHSASE